MSTTNTIDRLRAANPANVQSERAHSDAARVALERILREPPTSRRDARRRLPARLPRGGVAVAIALGLAGGGAAFASPAGILVLLAVIAVVALVWWVFNH